MVVVLVVTAKGDRMLYRTVLAIIERLSLQWSISVDVVDDIVHTQTGTLFNNIQVKFFIKKIHDVFFYCETVDF